MAIKINDNTITGDIYHNDVRVQKVYINNELAWEGLPGNNITLTIYRRGNKHNVPGYDVPCFRILLTAEYPVASTITVNVRYNTSEPSTTVTIYANERYGVTGWRKGNAYSPIIEGVSPQSDSTYRYTYTPYGDIEVRDITEPIDSLVTAEAIQYYYPPPVPVKQLLTLKVESQYYVENWTVEARLYLRTEPTPFIAITTLQNTKSKSLSITEEYGTKCEWQRIDYPSSFETGYYYIPGPTTFRVIDNR